MDITADLKSLQNGAILLAEGFTLFDAMSATELFDKKIDIKIGLADADTPRNLLAAGKIKTASQLSPQELVGLYDLVLRKWMSWLNGHALAQTVYTLVYQYDSTLWDHPFIRALFETLNTVGAQIFKIVKDSPFLREEDYNPSVFGFRKERLPAKELLTQVLNPLDAELTAKLKKTKQPTINDALAMRVKVLKGFAMLVDLLAQFYTPELHKQIEQQIEFIRKRIDVVVDTVEMGADVQNYDSATILKHIRSMVSMRKIPVMEQHYQYFKTMLVQLEGVLDLAGERNLFAIVEKVNNLIHSYPKNTLIRAYLETSIFKYETLQYFRYVSWASVLVQTLNKMYPHLSFEHVSEHKQFMDCFVPIAYDYLIRQLKQKFRKMRDFGKHYQHLSVLVHYTNELDQKAFKHKNQLMIFSYELAMQMMISQLFMGFELELYSDCDLPIIYFYSEYFISILEKNRYNYIHQLPQTQAEQLAKTRKKISPIVDQLYHEQHLWKGFFHFFKALSRLTYALMQHNYIQSADEYSHRYSNRLKIFEHCYYIKPLTFQDFESNIKLGSLDEALSFTSEHMKEAQDKFRQVHEQKQLSDTVLKQAQDLVKICVITSVNALSLKTNPTKKVRFSKTSIPFVQQFELY